MRQRKQLPPQFSVQERAHALATSYKTSACMHEVDYITVTDLTETSWLGKDQLSIDSEFLYKAWKERKFRYFVDILYVYVLLTKCALFS